MTDVQIKCDANTEIRSSVHKSGVSYRYRIQISFYNEALGRNEELATEIEEEPSIVPSWFTKKTAKEDSEMR